MFADITEDLRGKFAHNRKIKHQKPKKKSISDEIQDENFESENCSSKQWRSETEDQLEMLKCEIKKLNADTKNLFANIAKIRVLVHSQQEELKRLLNGRTYQNQSPSSVQDTSPNIPGIFIDHLKKFQDIVEHAFAMVGITSDEGGELMFQPKDTELGKWCMEHIENQKATQNVQDPPAHLNAVTATKSMVSTSAGNSTQRPSMEMIKAGSSTKNMKTTKKGKNRALKKPKESENGPDQLFSKKKSDDLILPPKQKGQKRQRSDSLDTVPDSNGKSSKSASKSSKGGCTGYANAIRSYVATRRYPKRHTPTKGDSAAEDGDDTDDMCDVCMRGESKDEPLLTCTGCDVQVHQHCYGMTDKPGKTWTCIRCHYGVPSSVECSLCLQPGGAMKRFNDEDHWAHVQCGWWDPDTEEVGDESGLQEWIKLVVEPKKARKKLLCKVCKKPGGLCIQCAYPNCYLAMHTRCASSEGYLDVDLQFSTVVKIPFCRRHSQTRAFREDILRLLQKFVNECEVDTTDNVQVEAIDTIQTVLEEASAGALDAKEDAGSWEGVNSHFKSFESCITMVLDCLVESKLITGRAVSDKRRKVETLLKILEETLQYEWIKK